MSDGPGSRMDFTFGACADVEAVPQQLVDLLDARLAQECAKALG